MKLDRLSTRELKMIRKQLQGYYQLLDILKNRYYVEIIAKSGHKAMLKIRAFSEKSAIHKVLREYKGVKTVTEISLKNKYRNQMKHSKNIPYGKGIGEILEKMLK